MTTLLAVIVTSSAHPTLPDVGVFAVSAAIVLAGAIGVVVARNPVHSALMLVMTLFGIAVLFVLQQASFLAAVQVIVYAGAIVVLFLFVIMFLGVDKEENVAAEPLRGQRPLAVGLVALGTTGLLLLGQVSKWTTGQPHAAGLRHRRPQRQPDRQVALHDLPVPLRGHLGIADHRRGRCRGAGPPAAGGDLLRPHRGGRLVPGSAGRLPGHPRWHAPRRRRADGARNRRPTERGRDRGRRGGCMSISPAWYLSLSVVLFAIGALGVLVRRNVLIMFMCVELMLNASNLAFVTFARQLHDIGGQVLVFFVLVVAAAEVVVGLGIVVAIFRRRASTNADDLHLMKG